MRIREATIEAATFAIYATAVHCTVCVLSLTLAAHMPFAVLPMTLRLAPVMFLGAFIVALPYLRRHRLDCPSRAATLGTLSVTGVYALAVLAVTAGIMGGSIPAGTAGPLSNAADFGVASLLYTPILLPFGIFGALAGLLYGHIKRLLAFAPAP